MSDKKYLYLFSEGNKDMREILGGKGANLAEMTNAGMPVPQGFTISTEACTQYYNDGRQINEGIMADIYEYIGKMEEIVGKKFGDPANPLLVSVRSGARASMPGMMDTILNLGLNDEVVEGLAKKTGNPRFAYDSYRRFVQMFSDVVMEMNKSEFEKIIDEMKEAKGVTQDVELDADDMKALVAKFKSLYKEKMGADFPTDPKTQLIEAVKAVFRSWDNPRANTYRRMNEIPYDWGTAVNVQAMVFGNSGENSGTGVAFTRNPATGEKALFGEYLINAQGEDVVAGIRTPSPISHLKDQMPEVYDQFVTIATKLENHYRDMQDMEFTIEDGKLYMLQTRNGKRTAAAALKIAVDLVDEGMITEKEAVLRVEPKQLDTLLHPQFDAAALKAAEVVGKGLAASPGSACGQIVFTAEEAEEMVKSGKMKKVVDVYKRQVRTQQSSGERRSVGRGLAIQHRVDVGQGSGDGSAESGGLGAGSIGGGSVAALGGGLGQLKHLGALVVISTSEGAGVVERHDHITDVDHLVLEVAGQLCVGDGGLAVGAVAHLEQVVALDEDALEPLEGVEADAVGLIEVAVLLHQLGGVAVGLRLLVGGQHAAQLIETSLDGGVGLEVLEGLLGHIVADHGGLAGGVIDGDGGLEEAGHLGGVLVVGSEVGGGLVGIELG